MKHEIQIKLFDATSGKFLKTKTFKYKNKNIFGTLKVNKLCKDLDNENKANVNIVNSFASLPRPKPHKTSPNTMQKG